LENQALTSGLLKWRQAQRPSILTRKRGTSLGDIPYEAFVPKLSDELCASAYKKILLQVKSPQPQIIKADLQGLIKRSNNHELERTLVIAPTAYNFINAFPLDGMTDYDLSSYSMSPQFVIKADSSKQKYQIYAVVISSIAYWLWHVMSDGFHITTSYLRSLAISEMSYPMSQIIELQNLGEIAWDRAKKYSIQSTNGGRKTLSFHIPHGDWLISEIDSHICRVYGISTDEYTAINKLVDTVTVFSHNRIVTK